MVRRLLLKKVGLTEIRVWTLGGVLIAFSSEKGDSKFQWGAGTHLLIGLISF